MVVIDLTAGRKPETVQLVIRQGDNWQTSASMTEADALELAAQCRKRGLTAEVVRNG